MKIMLNFFKNKWLLLIIVLNIFIILILSGAINKTEVKKTFYKTNLSNAEQITCTYPQILSTSYINNKISHTLNKPETNPLIFTFSKYTGESGGQLSYLDATRAITNVPLVKLLDNNEKIIFIDGNAQNYLSIHIIYKKEGVSSYTKNVNILGIPVGSLAMGSCIGY